MKAIGDCVIWRGHKDRAGYGRKMVGGKRYMVHRLMYELTIGRPIQKAMVVMHVCDNPSCINPQHLVLGTPADNARDMIAKGRSRSQKQTHCKYGHPFSGANLRFRMNGGARRRVCVTCLSKRWAREWTRIKRERK